MNNILKLVYPLYDIASYLHIFKNLLDFTNVRLKINKGSHLSRTEIYLNYQGISRKVTYDFNRKMKYLFVGFNLNSQRKNLKITYS